MKKQPLPIVEAVRQDPVVQAAIHDAAVIQPSPPAVGERGQLVAAPTATEEEERVAEGQRRINLIWETTQSIVALGVTGFTLYVSASLALEDKPDTAAFLLLSNVFFLVLGTYFSRTNHQKTGGVGKNDMGR